MKPVDCDITDMKTSANGTRIDVKIKGRSTYAVSFRMSASGMEDAKPVRVIATSSGRISEDDPYEVVDLPAGKHQIVVEVPDDCQASRTYVGLLARTYNVLDRIVEELD